MNDYVFVVEYGFYPTIVLVSDDLERCVFLVEENIAKPYEKYDYSHSMDNYYISCFYKNEPFHDGTRITPEKWKEIKEQS